MAERRAPPTPGDVRCPECTAIAWRRLGERVLEGPGDTDGTTQLSHSLVNEDGPWEWTCEACGYQVKAGSRLDHQISAVQPRRRLWRDALGIIGLGDAAGGSASGPRQSATSLQSTIAVVGVAAVAVVLVVALGYARAPSAPDTAGSSPETCARVGEDLAAIRAGSDRQALDGKCLDVDGARVESVTGDVTFWIGQSEAERVFVVFNEATQGERRVEVREGQRVRIAGTLQRTPVSGVELTSADRAALADEDVYIFAERVEIQGG